MNIKILMMGFMSFSACDSYFNLSPYPNNQDALKAIQNMTEQINGANSSSLTSSIYTKLVKRVVVKKCQRANPQDGVICQIEIVSNDIPVIGGVAVPYTFRFVKNNEIWVAYLN